MKNPLDIFKRWLLNLLVPYIEGTNKKKKDKPKLSSLGKVKIRQWGKTKASIAENKNFEKMEMVIGDYRIYTHRPGGIKIKRISDKKQLAVIGDNLKVKYSNYC